MWTHIVSLKDALELLPEPIMIVGNRVPDGDSLGSCVAVLEYLIFLGREAYIHCAQEPDASLAWMLAEDDVCESILEDYQSLVVLDDRVDSSRLGFFVKPEVPIVCVDHHMGNFPDSHIEQILANPFPTVHFLGSTIYFHELKPATACVLMDEGIYHPYLWVSLFTDTAGFKVNCVEGVDYAASLSANLGLTSLQVEEMMSNLNKIASPQDLHALLNGSIYMISGSHEGSPISLIVATASANGSLPYKRVLSALLSFADVVAFVNQETGQASFRSRLYSFDVLSVAQKFGGGGHLRAAGATLNMDGPSDFDRLVSIMLDRIDNPQTTWYV